jgi:hypothetical protein
MEDLLDLLVEGGDPSVEVAEKIIELTDGIARHWRQFVVEVRQDIGDQATGPGHVLCHGKATIEQEAADLADNGRAVIDHALPRAVQGLDVLLLEGLLRDEGDMRLTRGRDDRLGVIAIIACARMTSRIAG